MTSGVRTSRSPCPADVGESLSGYGVLMPAAILLGLGLVLVYSSSAVYSSRVFGDAEQFVVSQLGRAAVGILLLFSLSRVSERWWLTNAKWLALLSLVLCGLVLIPGLGVFRGGARRWLDVGIGVFQPSELAKFSLVVVMAVVLSRREQKPAAEQRSLWVPVAVAQIPIVLVLLEPDLGTALVMELIVAAMIFVGGIRLRSLIVLGLAALPAFYHLVVGTPFRLRRLLGYIDPWAYRSTVGYQVTEAMISMGSGGMTGLGLGEGKHRMFFLPEAHTDFIFAILGQELGLFGVLVVVGAFAWLLSVGASLSRNARNPFDRYVALGVTVLIGIPAVINMCVVTGLLPTKGLPLPLVSYGGSNLLATLAALGLLLRVSQHDAKKSIEAEPASGRARR